VAVSFVDIASSGSDTLSSSRSVTKPGGVSAGDVAVFHLHRWNASSSFPNVTTVPSGAVQVGSTVGASGFIESRIYAMYVGAETSYTFDWGSDVWTVLHAQFWTGVASGLDLTTLPVDIGAGSSSTTLPSRTVTTTAGAGLAWFCNSHNYAGGETHTPPTGGYSEVADNEAGSMAVKIATGTSETASGGTITGAQITITALVALPAAGGGSTIIANTGDAPADGGSTTFVGDASVSRVAVTTGAPGSTAAFSPTLPTNSAGDRMTLVVTGKYNTTTVPTINQGWTLVGSGTGGTGSTGNDSGQTFWAVYQKDSTGSETAPTVTPGGTGPNSWEWVCVSHRLVGPGAAWADTIAASGDWVKAASDTSTASPLTGTAAAFGTAPTTGDAIFCVGVVPTDLGSALGTTTLTATGLSGGTKSTATTQYVENSLGQDTAAVWADWTGFTGTASAGVAMSFTITGASNQSGSLVAITLRKTVTSSANLVALVGDAAADGGTATFSTDKMVALAGDAPAAGGSVTFRADPSSPLVTSVSGNSRYLLDQFGAPIIPMFDTLWPVIQQSGNTARNGGSATWDQDIDFWISTRQAQGFNSLKFNLFGSTVNGSPNNDSRTWDSKWPFGSTAAGTSYANPSAGLASDYWTRVDYLFTQAAQAGMTCFAHIFYNDDVSIGGVMTTGAGGGTKNISEFQALGTALANRYKDYFGIVWVVGGDYFDTELTKVEACVTNLLATDTNHLFTVQNWANVANGDWTTSRQENSGATMQLGTDFAMIDSVYTYGQTYVAGQTAYNDTPTLPVIWYDGYYDQGSGDQLQMRRYVGWCLTYGMWGCQFGDESVWAQPNGWRTAVSSPDASVSHITTMRSAIAGIDGWQTIVPDSSSTFITAGRGSGNTFVTGGRAADGSLALIYMPVASTAITVDTTQMTAGYTVTWIDPINGATTAGTPGTTFSKGNNSGGSTDWFLMLAAPTSSPGNFSATAGNSPADGGSATLTGGGTFGSTAGDAPADGGSVSFTGAATFVAAAADAPAAGGSASFSGAGTFGATAGDAPADGGSTTFGSTATFSAVAGDAPADGGTTAFTGAATFATATGDSPADGATAAMVVPATFTALAADAPADGGSAILTGAATFAAAAGDCQADGGTTTFTGAAALIVTVGDAPADGGVAAATGAAVLAALAGDAPAEGGVASLVGGAASTFTAVVGDAGADGGVVTFTAPSTFSALVGDAPAGGGSATFTATAVFATVVGTVDAAGGTATLVGGAVATFTATVGDAPVNGGTASFTAGGTFSATTADASADGGSVTLTGAAMFLAIVGDSAASGGAVAFIGGASGDMVATAGDALAEGGLATLKIKIIPCPPADDPHATLALNRHRADLVHNAHGAELQRR
jgi:hypothetical protein